MGTTDRSIAQNTILLYIRLIVVIFVAFFTQRLVLKALGVEDYGIYNVVGGLIVVIGIINTGMIQASQRFFAFEIGRGKQSELKNIFGAALTIHALISIFVLLFAEILGVWFLNSIMTIPPDRLLAANFVFQATICSLLITVWTVPFDALIIAKEDFNIYAYISIVEYFLKLGIAYFISTFELYDKLIIYSWLLVLVTILCKLWSIIYGKRKYKECLLKFNKDRNYIKKMLSFASFSFIGNIGFVLRNQGVNLVLNIFFGPTVNAARGITVQVQNAIQGFATNFQTALNPQITKSYAAYNWDYTKFLLFLSSRVSIFLLFIISLPVLLETNQILTWWLDTPPDYTDKFIKIILLITMIDALANPIIVAAQATGKIKKYQMTVGGCLLLTPVMAYIALKLTHEPTMVFITQLCIAIIAQFIRIMIIKKMLNFSMQEYFKSTVMPIFKACLPAFCICWGITYLLEESFVRFFTTILSSVIINVIFIWFFGFNKNERKQISVVIKQKIKKGK